MTHHRSRTHPEPLPHPSQRHHHRPQRRLHHLHPPQRHPIPQHLQQRNTQKRLQRRRTLPQPLRKHRNLTQQPQRHPHPLRPLTRKHKNRPPTIRPNPHNPRTTRNTRTTLTPRQRPHPTQQLLPRPTHHHRTMPLHTTTRRQGETHVGRGHVRPGVHERRQPLRLAPECVSTAGREHPGHHGGHITTARRFDRCGCLFEDEVGVGAADPERRHSRPAQPPHLGPGTRPVQQPHPARRPVDMRRRPLGMQRHRQRALPQPLHHLDHPGHTGGGLRVPDIRLHRPQPQRPLGITPLPIRRQQRLRLDRITEPRPGAVRLHHIHIRGPQPGIRQSRPDHPLLRGTAGCREAVGRTVLVDRTAPHDREHPVPVAPGVRQPLQHQDAHALGPRRAVGVHREGLAAAVCRQSPLPGELAEHAGGRHDGHSAGQGEIALARPQRPARQMHGDQRRRARRVHRHRRPLEAERVGHPAREHAGGAAGEDLTREVGRGPGGHGGRSRVRWRRRRPPWPSRAEHPGPVRPARGLPRRFRGAAAAAGPSPAPHAARSRRSRRRSPPRRRGIRRGGCGFAGVRRVWYPAAIGGPGRGGGSAVGDEPPQVVRRGDSPGVATGHADHGNGFVVGAPRSCSPFGCRAGRVVVRPGVGRGGTGLVRVRGPSRGALRSVRPVRWRASGRCGARGSRSPGRCPDRRW